MKIIQDVALTFDDLLLVPQYCQIASRKYVSLKTRLTKNISIESCILSANMDTITESCMMIAMDKQGCVGVLHRFMPKEKMFLEVENFSSKTQSPIVISVGLNENVHEKLFWLDRRFDNPIVVCIDTPNAYYDRVIALLKDIKSNYSFDVIVGNVSTPEAVKCLCKNGASGIKVNIGAGSFCSTRIVSGVGTPQATAIKECAEAAYEFDVPIIADGGVKNSGDVVKSLALGADSVMSGFLFRATTETPGEIVKNNDVLYKSYRGMASFEAMKDWKGSNYHAAPEGVSKLVKLRGQVEPILKELLAGIRSGLSYCNACTIQELHEKAVFRVVSAHTKNENSPNGLGYE